jgi:hypothetical protein
VAARTDLAVERLESPFLQSGQAVNDAPEGATPSAVAEGDH